MKGIAVGLVIALGVGALARWRGFDRDRSFYPTVLIVIAWYYVLFGVMGGSTRALWLEVAGMSVFMGLATAGHARSHWLVVAGLAGHGLFDLVHGHVVNDPGVPDFWPPFCAAADLGLAALAALGPAPARAQKSL